MHKALDVHPNEQRVFMPGRKSESNIKENK